MVSIRPRYVLALFVAFAVMAAVASFVVRTPRSEAADLVHRFAQALDERDVAAAAALTSYPNAAAQTITQLFDGMHTGSSTTRVSQYIGLDNESGFFTLDSTWSFGEPAGADSRQWQFTSRGTTHKLAMGWRISWDPAVVSPDLRDGRTIAYTRTDTTPPVVLDATGAPMMTQNNVAAVHLDPTAMPDPVASTTALADVIDVVAPLITSDTLLEQLADAHGSMVTAVNLRADDYAVLEDDLRAIPGVVLYAEPTLITGDRRLDSPLLDSMRSLWQSSRDATAGWAVTVTDPDGTSVREAGFQGPPPPDLTSTLDPHIQLAAQEAAVSAATPASVVVIKPSTGELVAVAQNSYANELGTPALTSLYPAGPVPDSVRASAHDLGLATTYDLPGASLVTGKLPGGNSDLDQFRAREDRRSVVSALPAALQKDDGIEVTPFGLAELGAAVVRGSAPTPSIVRGQPATVSDPGGNVSANTLVSLRSVMGDGGLTGGAGDDRWVVTTNGDLAVAVYVEDADGSDQAVRLTSRLFREMAVSSFD